jgi:hypothetical protein
MDEELRAGYPSSGMLIFAAVWLGVLGYAALNGSPAPKQTAQALESRLQTDLSSSQGERSATTADADVNTGGNQ